MFAGPFASAKEAPTRVLEELADFDAGRGFLHLKSFRPAFD
jgi:hypothetical protein